MSVQQFGDMFDIDAAAFVEDNGASASAVLVISGGAGGEITRSEKIGPGFAVSVSRS